MNQVVHIFREVNMSCQHDGLAEVARSGKVSLRGLGAGEHVLFLNRACTAVKLFSAGNLVSYKKAEKGHRLNLEMIQHIPTCFGADGMNWDKAEEKALNSALAKKGIQ